jgi:DHA2 family multidrug resistance protein-like MFS transporter
VLVIPGVIVSMDSSILFLALPFVSADLQPTSSELLWIGDIYGFLLAGLLIVMGTLGDLVGRRRLLMVGAAAFAVASIVAAYSPSAPMLITARALLGIAGATLAPSTLSLIRNIFHREEQRQVAIGMWAAGFALGALLGPIVGGLLLQRFWWGSVFLVNVPAMLLLLVLGGTILPEFRNPRPGRFDLQSAVLCIASVLLVIFGVKRTAEVGFQWSAALAMCVGLIVGIAFVRRQQSLAEPMIDLTLFRNRSLSTALVAGILGLFGMVGFALFISQYLQLVLAMEPLVAALWLLPSFAAMIVGTVAATPLTHLLRRTYVLSGALAVAAIGCFILTRLDAEGALRSLIVGHATIAAGVGVVMTLATEMVVAGAPVERAGVASAVSETGTEFGGALGIAILGSIGMAVYRGRVLESGIPGLPWDAVQVAANSLGGATELAATLPDPVGLTLLASARLGFTEGIAAAAMAAACLLTCAAVAVILLLRNVSPVYEFADADART